MQKNIDNSKQKILKVAASLFSTSAYSNVSIREIATAAGIKSASLYYHFPNKEAIYLATIEHAFSNKANAITEVLNLKLPAIERLKLFIYKFTELMSHDEEFRLLLRREILDGNDERLKYIAHEVFNELFNEFGLLIHEISPSYDVHMLNISITSLIIHHLDSFSIRQFLPGYKPEHEDPDYISEHVFKLLTHDLTQ